MIHQKNVVITGGTGFIGANLVYRLHHLGYTVHLFAQEHSNFWRVKKIYHDLVIHTVDLGNINVITKVMKEIQPIAIFHLASYGNSSEHTDIERIVTTNMLFTTNLLLASKDINYKLFVNTGSSSEYGENDQPMKEIDPLHPNSFYAAAKAGSTYLCQVFANVYNKPIVTLRPFSIYGPFEAKGRFIPTIIINVIKKQPIALTSGSIRRDFVYIDDMVDAYIRCLHKKNLSGKVINIGTGNEYLNDDVVRTLFTISGKSVPVKQGAFHKRSWDTIHWRADNSLAKELLDWTPSFTLEKGMRLSYEWFKENASFYE